MSSSHTYDPAKEPNKVFRIILPWDLIQITGAIVLGLLILFGTGFAQARIAHDGAHDSRHSISLPCH